MGAIAKGIGALLQVIYNYVGVYGIAIIILTIIVKACLYPLYAIQTKSTARMSEFQPRIQELQKKYANDKDTLNLKMQELYKEEKINPMAGCLPILIQMPIIIGLFTLLRNPLKYMAADNNMIFAVHDSFLWMPDLTQPDKWILPIAAAVATYFSFLMTQAITTSPDQGQMNGMMKGMRYVFPVMILWIARSYPSGLSIYWFVSQLVQILINLRLNVIRKRIREGNDKDKKKKRKR